MRQKMTRKYAVIFEKGKTSYGAYAPDIPGCVAVGKDLKKVQRLIREAIEFHLDGMMLHGESIPESTSRCSYIEVKLPKLNGKVLVPKRRKAQTQ
jgi:predicted RNase H-like HicB family nuclease